MAAPAAVWWPLFMPMMPPATPPASAPVSDSGEKSCARAENDAHQHNNKTRIFFIHSTSCFDGHRHHLFVSQFTASPKQVTNKRATTQAKSAPCGQLRHSAASS